MLSLHTITVASSLFALSAAFERVSVPTSIAADTDFKLTIVNDINGGVEDSASHSSFDAQFEAFRVYLATTPPGWGTGPVCYLENSTSINTTSLTLQISASVGPSSEDAYSLSLMEFNPPGQDGPSGFQYTNTFDFTKGTGSWSEYELNGMVIGDPDNLPCTAYGCARDCTTKFYPANSANITDDSTKAEVSAAEAAAKSTYECVAACPGVTYESWDSITSGDDDDSDDSSSTEGGSSASTTQSTSPTQSASTTTSRSSSSSSTASPTSSASGAQTSSPSAANTNNVAFGFVILGLLAQLAWGY